MEKRFEPYSRLAAIIGLTVGCLYVLRPFFGGMLFAACIAISSWPLYLKLLGRMKQRRTLAAAVMTTSLVLVILLPLALVTWNIADNAGDYYRALKGALEAGTIETPAWLKQIPMVGESVDAYVNRILQQLRRDRLIDLRSGTLVVHDPEQLASIGLASSFHSQAGTPAN